MMVVTNGDGAAFAIQQAGIHAAMVPWRDVLHDGPVPHTDTDAALAAVRAQFIADAGWGDVEDVRRSFTHRDASFAGGLANREEVVLWFEHDLYDQLQLIQVLERVHRWGHAGPVTLICHAEFIAESTFEVLQERFAARQPVTDVQLSTAATAWDAFRGETPDALMRFGATDHDELPYLGPAVRRLLEEYPAANGLARSERQILEVVRDGAPDRRRAFHAVQEREEAKYLGDWSFDRYVDGLMRPPEPLLTSPEGSRALAITTVGAEVLDGRRDWVAIGGIDRWVGGVHLTPERLWRWSDGKVAIDTSYRSPPER